MFENRNFIMSNKHPGMLQAELLNQSTVIIFLSKLYTKQSYKVLLSPIYICYL